MLLHFESAIFYTKNKQTKKRFVSVTDLKNRKTKSTRTINVLLIIIWVTGEKALLENWKRRECTMSSWKHWLQHAPCSLFMWLACLVNHCSSFCDTLVCVGYYSSLTEHSRSTYLLKLLAKSKSCQQRESQWLNLNIQYLLHAPLL